jgi:hypothetical protein
LKALGADKPELALFSAWLAVASGERPELPPAPDDPAGRVLHLATRIAGACLTGDRGELDAAVDALGDALAELDPDDPRAAVARGFADLAVGDAAQWSGEVAIARRRYEDVAEAGRPVALRIAALLKLAGASLGRDSVEPARTWARKALTLAEHGTRMEHATRARMLLGMLHHIAGDMTAARRTLAPNDRSSPLARILLASMERANRAMPLLADGLREASERGDVLGYALCILIGARRYAAIGHDADALVTVSAGIVQLRHVAPHLSRFLEEERRSWETTWDVNRFRRAEQAAMDLLDRE